MTNEYGFIDGLLHGIAKIAEAEAEGKVLPIKVFDWSKATKILEQKGWPDAEAGLISDWESTGGIIVKNGQKVHDSYTYLASKWATPALLIDNEYIDCWRYIQKSPGWNSETKWPDNA